MGSDAPVESSVRYAGLRGSPPENPRGEDSVKESLDKSGAEEVLAFVAFKLDAKRLLEREFDGAEAPQGVILGASAGFSRVGGEKPGYILGLYEGGAVEHHTREKVRQQIPVAREGDKRGSPQCWLL